MIVFVFLFFNAEWWSVNAEWGSVKNICDTNPVVCGGKKGNN